MVDFSISAFVFIQFLALLTTFVDVASGRRTPSPFGSQHVALLLGAWCPVVIFGMSSWSISSSMS